MLIRIHDGHGPQLKDAKVEGETLNTKFPEFYIDPKYVMAIVPPDGLGYKGETARVYLHGQATPIIFRVLTPREISDDLELKQPK